MGSRAAAQPAPPAAAAYPDADAAGEMRAGDEGVSVDVEAGKEADQLEAVAVEMALCRPPTT